MINIEQIRPSDNCTNTPHFSNPSTNSANRSNLQLNPDGSVRNLNGFAEITGTRADFPERQIRFGLRLGF